MRNLFENSQKLMIKQVKEMFEIVINWETSNRYEIYNEQKIKVGYAGERTNGFFHRILRNIMRSHRSITVDIWDKNNKLILCGHRPWYFFFSDLNVQDTAGNLIGDIKTKVGILKRKYEINDRNNNLIASIESYRWRLWTFTIYDPSGTEVGVITKKWGGLLKEIFTDADQFMIDYSRFNWNDEQKALLLFACLSVDLDFFEDNHRSVLDIFNN